MTQIVFPFNSNQLTEKKIKLSVILPSFSNYVTFYWLNNCKNFE